MHYRREIDGLRAIAVGSVVLAHAGAPLAGGHLGVDIFFVISGFLITSILMRELGQRRFSLGRFYERRARRILPALGLVALVCLPMGWLLMPPDQFTLLGQSLVALGLFATNILFWLTSGYFAPAAAEIPLLHTWSLAVEEQFYVLAPLALLLLWARPGLLFRAMAGLFALSLLAMTVVSQTDASAAFYLLPFRAWELLAGVLLALRPNAISVGDRSAGTLAVAGLGLILTGLLALHPGLPMAPVWAVIPVSGTVLVLAFTRPGGLVWRMLSAAPLVGLGLISYSVYLWHQPLFAFARIGVPGPLAGWQMALLVLATLGLGWATWRYVELPFRDGTRVPTRRLVWFGSVAAIAIVAGGFSLHLGKGFGPQRFEASVLHVLDTAKPSPLRGKCHFAPGKAPEPQDACVYFAGDAPASWAVLGDSHGVELAYALARKIAPTGEGLVHLTASACPPALLFDPDPQGCAAWTKRSVAWLETQPQIKTVVLAWRHAYYLHGDPSSQGSDQGNAPARHALYWQSLQQIVSRLSVDGRRVIMLLPVPELPQRIQAYALHGAGGAIETISAADHASRSGAIAARLTALTPHVLSPEFCGPDKCVGSGPEGAYYFDSNHLSVLGAHKVLQTLPPDILPLRLSDHTSSSQTPSPPAPRWQ